MVELDIFEGLLTEMEVIWGVRVLRQKLDYLHIPLKYFYHRNTSHVKAHCPYLLMGSQPALSKELVASPTSYFFSRDNEKTRNFA